ncbi:DNA-protecting protein DprA, partial [Candidatus Azambacteria bacterium]|nr:DNA-protecting protein DprA [Candidatus Azambacteria bacterium]
ASYPPLLKEIHLPPPILSRKGEIQPEDRIAAGIVGTRFCSYYGKIITPRFAGELARTGVTIVSGLAKGIDFLAHREALAAGGRTIAVVGSGLDRESFYPPEHWDFSKDITQRGAVLTEFPPGVPALPRHFPQRNRIIAGLSLGVLVIEAPEKSGALLTAELALEQNRTVYAVPGPITARSSEGTNALIKLGAKPITRAAEILEDLRLQAMPVPPRLIELTDPTEKAVFEHLSAEEPVHVDDLAKAVNISPAALNATLAVLEVKGAVRNLGANHFVRT